MKKIILFLILATLARADIRDVSVTLKENSTPPVGIYHVGYTPLNIYVTTPTISATSATLNMYNPEISATVPVATITNGVLQSDGTWLFATVSGNWTTNATGTLDPDCEVTIYGDVRLNTFGNPLPPIEFYVRRSYNTGSESAVDPFTFGWQTNGVAITTPQYVNIGSNLTGTTSGTTLTISADTQAHALAGDVSGDSANNTVDKIKNIPVTTNGIVSGNVLAYDGTNFSPSAVGSGTITGVGIVAGTGLTGTVVTTSGVHTQDLALSSASIASLALADAATPTTTYAAHTNLSLASGAHGGELDPNWAVVSNSVTEHLSLSLAAGAHGTETDPLSVALTGDTMTGDLILDDGVGSSPYSIWRGADNVPCDIRKADGGNMEISSGSGITLDANGSIDFSGDTLINGVGSGITATPDSYDGYETNTYTGSAITLEPTKYSSELTLTNACSLVMGSNTRRCMFMVNVIGTNTLTVSGGMSLFGTWTQAGTNIFTFIPIGPTVTNWRYGVVTE